MALHFSFGVGNFITSLFIKDKKLYKCGKIAFFDEKWILTDKDGPSSGLDPEGVAWTKTGD